MDKTSIVERFRALRWEIALPAPDDDVATRRQKREDLERALEVKRALLCKAEASFTFLPTGPTGDVNITNKTSQRPAPTDMGVLAARPLNKRLRRVTTDAAEGQKDLYQTPPSQRVPAPGGAYILQREREHTAALTAQGLHVSTGNNNRLRPDRQRLPQPPSEPELPRRGASRLCRAGGPFNEDPKDGVRVDAEEALVADQPAEAALNNTGACTRDPLADEYRGQTVLQVPSLLATHSPMARASAEVVIEETQVPEDQNEDTISPTPSLSSLNCMGRPSVPSRNVMESPSPRKQGTSDDEIRKKSPGVQAALDPPPTNQQTISTAAMICPESEPVPPTPAGLFDFSETPGSPGAIAALERIKAIPGSALGADESNRLLPGVFSMSNFAPGMGSPQQHCVMETPLIDGIDPGPLAFSAEPMLAPFPLSQKKDRAGEPAVRTGGVYGLAETSAIAGNGPHTTRRGPVSAFKASFPSTVVRRSRIVSKMGSTLKSTPTVRRLPVQVATACKSLNNTSARYSIKGPRAGQPTSVFLRTPQPALLAVASPDGRYVAIVLGSHADGDPCEVLLFRHFEDGGQTKDCLTIVASVSVQRSRHAFGLSLPPGSVILAQTSHGDPVILLSAFYELLDAPTQSERPTLHAVPCGNYGCSPNKCASSAVGVEHDDPLFALALVGPTTVVAAGDGAAGAFVLQFDPNWRSYTWGKPLATAAAGQDDAIDDICALVRLSSCFDDAVHQNTRLLGISASGLVAVWDLQTRECISAGADMQYSISSVVPLPGLRFRRAKSGADSGSEHPPSSTVFLATVQHRETQVREMMVAILTPPTADAEPTLLFGNPLPMKGIVTATVLDGCDEWTLALGLEDGTLHFVKGFNSTGDTSSGASALDAGAGDAITSVALLHSGDGKARPGSLLVATYAAGGVMLLTTQELLKAVE